MHSKRILVWDLPTRLFHWLLALTVLAAVVTGQIGGSLMDWHGRLGLAIVGLLAFRLAWGFVGSTYARFAHFFPTPARLAAYLRGDWRGEGHTPLGAVSVLALLGLLLVQALTGLPGNDDIAFQGPFYELVGQEWSNRLTGLHHLASNALIALGLLHVAAIAYHVRIRKHDLLKPMFTGRKAHSDGVSARRSGWPAFAFSLAIAFAAVYGASGAWLPEPPPPPPVETPAW